MVSSLAIAQSCNKSGQWAVGWDQTRGLQEILGEMDELVDKVWYNRHMNRTYHIEQGTITFIPEGTERKSNGEIHQHIWKGALAAAEKVRSQYENIGPWGDFEWGSTESFPHSVEYEEIIGTCWIPEQ